MSMTVNLRLFQKTVFGTVASLGQNLQLSDSAEKVYKAVEECGLPVKGFFVHNPNAKELSADDIIGIAVVGEVKGEALENLRFGVVSEGITISNPQPNRHNRELFELLFIGKK